MRIGDWQDEGGSESGEECAPRRRRRRGERCEGEGALLCGAVSVQECESRTEAQK